MAQSRVTRAPLTRRTAIGALTAGLAVPALLRAGNFILGSSLFHLGQLEASFRHMTAALSPHVAAREPPKLVINERGQTCQCLRMALAPLRQ